MRQFKHPFVKFKFVANFHKNIYEEQTHTYPKEFVEDDVDVNIEK